MGLEGGSVSFLWQRVGHQAAKFAELHYSRSGSSTLIKTYLQLWSKPIPRSPKACNLILFLLLFRMTTSAASPKPWADSPLILIPTPLFATKKVGVCPSVATSC